MSEYGVQVRSGKFHLGRNCVIGENVVVDVAEEVVLGDRCVIPDNAYFGGRRIVIGDDFYGYSWEWNRLDIGRGRRDDELAMLTVGNRCTFHDNRIDLARRVTIGDDVGLSPEVAIYTHHYWMSPLDGFPVRYAEVTIGSRTIVGFRSTILAGAVIGADTVIGANCVIPAGPWRPKQILRGNPPQGRSITQSSNRSQILEELIEEYANSCEYRGISCDIHMEAGEGVSLFHVHGRQFNFTTLKMIGAEDELSDDFRDFLFKHGIRIYTQRPFRKMEKRR